MGFEPMIPVFERAKKFHALDRAAIVIGIHNNRKHKLTVKNKTINVDIFCA
jgi:hypothetical protein